jgi:hypothetical protein
VLAGLHAASVRLPVEVSCLPYTCINWRPYLRAWAGKYSGQDLVVIGLHIIIIIITTTPARRRSRSPSAERNRTAAAVV